MIMSEAIAHKEATKTETVPAVGVERWVSLSRELFRFENERHWVSKAKSWFANCGVPKYKYICLDAKGRVCISGAEFMRATKDDAYPIITYEI